MAQLDAELDAEEAKVKELLEVWENGMTDLIEKEYKLAVDRLAALRYRRLSDLPDRFGLLNEAFVEDTVALLLHRIERGLRKLSNSNAELEHKLAEGSKLVDQQVAKFDAAALDTKAQIAAFYEELLQHETQAIETSSAEVRRYAHAAKEAYDEIMRDAKFAVTMDEWQGWDLGVRKRAALFADELKAVQSGTKPVSKASGATDLSEAPDMQKEVKALRAHADKLSSAARRELVGYGDGALAQLGGGGVAAKVSEITDRLAEQASRVSTDAAAGMLGAVGVARSKLGLGEAASDGYVARAKAYVAAGSGSGSSFDDYVQGLSASVGDVGSSVSSVAAQASSSIASAVGVSTPATAKASSVVLDAASAVAAAAGAATDSAANVVSSASSVAAQASSSIASAVGVSTPATAKASSVVVDAASAVAAAAGAATDSAADVVSSASSVVSKASRSAASAVGASPTPESLEEYVDSFTARVDAAVHSASSVASQLSSSAVSAASAAPNAVSENVAAGISSASSLASQASRSAASAVGASPSPETLQDYVEAAQDQLRGVAEGVKSSAVSVADAAAEGVSSASSLASQASRSAASAVGATPSPETVQDYIEDATNAAQSLAARAHIEL